jgi:mono/diheme cytochrome c family protein
MGMGLAALLGPAVGALAEAASEAPAPSVPTYAGRIADIIHRNCTECHRPGGGAPMDFLTYEDVRARARMIARLTADRSMPPWKAAKGDVAFLHERHLADEDIAALADWVKAGTPLGDPGAVPAPPVFASGWHLGEPDLVLTMEEPFDIPAEGPDIYRGFVVRIPDLPEGTYLKGMDYKPQAVASAHHTLFSLDSTGDARLRDAASARPGFGGMENNLSLGRIGGWAVGAQPHRYPDGVAVPVPPGTDLVLATHFHPGGKAETEQARIGLYLTHEPPTRHFVALDVPFGFGLLKGIRIPAGEPDHVIREDFVLPADAELVGIAPHAHYVATSMHCTATLPDGETLRIISIPRWDFAWQEQYRLAKPLHLPAGTRLDMAFHYDNSADNLANPYSPPREITFGPESTDEMACMTLMLVSDSKETIETLKQGYAAWVKEDVKTADLGMLIESARAQRREAFDLNNDGTISAGEVLARAKIIRKRFTNTGPDSAQSEILGAISLRILRTVLLPWLAPRLAVLALVLVLLVLLLRHTLRTRRRRRQAASPA